ncbi:ABC transporter substrate-binding protein [Metabacillus indicus]|uniref:ABC transporter substrate-binding protein n=1 Tax=Metabacillus indicus TaxID=246786 RepID=UPI003CE97189
MKKFILIFSSLFLIFLAACSNSQNSSNDPSETLNKTWSEIEGGAKNKTVRIYMWGGDPGINKYMDEWVAPRLKKTYGITLKRVPMDAPEFLKKLANEKRAGNEEGNMDIIWINGENFKNAKDNGLLFGPFANKLPNYNEYVDSKALNVQYDFGTKVDGMEAPWGKVQFVFQYDEKKVENPPRNFDELNQWIKENPGKFAYPDPNDFTGNAFLRHLFYESVGDVKQILDEGYNENFANKKSDLMWTYLNDIKPYLWREGNTYPNNLNELDRLYSKGEVFMTMGYNEARAEKMIEQGIFPESTKTFVFESGSIGNFHFLAVPFNSPNKEGALTVINFLLSPDAQLTKLEPNYWGENMSLNQAKLSKSDQERLKSITRGSSVLSSETLIESLQPEVDAQYVTWLKEKWHDEVVQQN